MKNTFLMLIYFISAACIAQNVPQNPRLGLEKYHANGISAQRTESVKLMKDWIVNMRKNGLGGCLDSTSRMDSLFKYHYFYDGLLRISNISIEWNKNYWTSSQLNWQSSNQFTYTYVNNTHLLDSFVSFSPVFGHPFSSSAYTYDTADSLVQKIEYNYDSLTASFIPSSKSLYIRSAVGAKISEYRFQTWNPSTSSWNSQNKTIYTYAPQSIQTDFYDFVSGQWLPTAKTTYNYNVSQELINRETMSWKNGTWLKDSKMDCSYTNHLLTEVINYDSDSLGQQWFPNMKSQYTYNTQQALVFVENFTYNSAQVWEKQSIAEIAYDNDGDKILTDMSDYCSKTQKYELYLHQTFTYYDKTTANEPVFSVQKAYNIYPNPAKDMIFMENKQQNVLTLSLFDMNGRLQNQLKTSEEKIKWNIENLPAGIYQLQISEQNLPTFTQKWVKY